MNTRIFLVAAAEPGAHIIPVPTFSIEEFRVLFEDILGAIHWDLPHPTLVIDPLQTAYSGYAAAPGIGHHHREAVITLSPGALCITPLRAAYLIVHEITHSALQLSKLDASHAGHFCLLLTILLRRAVAAAGIATADTKLLPLYLTLYDCHESKIPPPLVLAWAVRTADKAPGDAPVSSLVDWTGREIEQFFAAWQNRQPEALQARREAARRRVKVRVLGVLSVSVVMLVGALGAVAAWM